MWRRLRPWLTVLAASAMGGVLGVLAAVWLPPWAAVVVGTASAGVAGIFTARAQDAINRGATGPPPLRRRVRDVADPIVLGVHPSAPAGGSDRVPEFVLRDAYQGLRERLRSGGFVLLIGESAAGKSRLAFEAMRDELPDHWFHRPLPGKPFDDLVPVVTNGGRHVVWLDELDLYLGAGGLTVDIVGRLLAPRSRGHVVILASMRVREYDRYSARHRDASDAAIWRAGRDVLLLAGAPLELPRGWSDEELGRARTAKDRRIAKAVVRAQRHGVAEILAAGPELVADWQRARTIGGHPRGAALVAGAVDCRRMGVHRPVPLDLLVSLHSTYLPDNVDVIRLESVEEAVGWASAVTYASSSLLIDHGGQHYLAFDYLIDQPFLPAVPDASWKTLLGHVTPAEAYDVGWAATDFQRPDHAIVAFEEARRHDVANAEYAYVLAWGNSGHAVGAAELLGAIAAERETRLGPDHPDTLQAKHDYARYLGESGRSADAARILHDVGGRRQRLLGADHPATIVAREYEAKFLGRAGDCDTAIRMLTEIAEQRHRILGGSHLDTLLTRINIARYHAKAGRPAQAARELGPLVSELHDQFGLDNPYSLGCRYEYARAIGDAGDPQAAIALLRVLLDDRLRVVGPRHPRTLSTRHLLARFIGEVGDPAAATQLFSELVADRTQVLGSGHARTIASSIQHARFLAAAGDPVRAATMLDDIQRACLEALGEHHPLTRLAEGLRGAVA